MGRKLSKPRHTEVEAWLKHIRANDPEWLESHHLVRSHDGGAMVIALVNGKPMGYWGGDEEQPVWEAALLLAGKPVHEDYADIPGVVLD